MRKPKAPRVTYAMIQRAKTEALADEKEVITGLFAKMPWNSTFTLPDGRSCEIVAVGEGLDESDMGWGFFFEVRFGGGHIEYRVTRSGWEAPFIDFDAKPN